MKDKMIMGNMKKKSKLMEGHCYWHTLQTTIITTFSKTY